VKHIVVILFFIIPSLSFSQLKNIVLEDKPVPKPTLTDIKVFEWNNAQKDALKLPQIAFDFFYWTNYSRENPKRFWDSVVAPILKTFPSLISTYTESLKTDLYNQTKLPLLKLNSSLIQTAQSHATDIGIHQGQPGHVSTDGRTFLDRLKAAGIKYCGGENVSLGDTDPILSLVLLYIDYGIPTLGHRKALLNATYTETGIGVANYGTGKTLFIVQDFSCSQQ